MADLTRSFLFPLKKTQQYFKMVALKDWTSRVLPEKDQKTPLARMNFLVIYSLAPNMAKISIRPTRGKQVHKFVLYIPVSEEGSVLELGQFFSEYDVLHTSGFCTHEDCICYEAYFPEEGLDIKKRAIEEKIREIKGGLSFKWEILELSS